MIVLNKGYLFLLVTGQVVCVKILSLDELAVLCHGSLRSEQAGVLFVVVKEW